jgi:FlaA1/EpsC-like NDP-sugar epimerase
MKSCLAGKSILATDSCGTVGVELIKQLLSNAAYSPSNIIGIDNNESELFF